MRAVGAAIAFVGLLAAALAPRALLVPARQVSCPRSSRGRLAYPLNYWNGLAALMALGIPLVLVPRSSRGGFAHPGDRDGRPSGDGAGRLLHLLPRRDDRDRGRADRLPRALPAPLEVLPTLALGVGGAALAIAAASQRSALVDNLQNATADGRVTRCSPCILIVCAGVALLRVALGLALRAGLWPQSTISEPADAALRSAAWRPWSCLSAWPAVPATAISTLGRFQAPGRTELEHRRSVSRARAETAATSGGRRRWTRYASAPLTGIGPGTFEFWWAKHGSIPGFVRNAHNLYLETLGGARDPWSGAAPGVLGSHLRRRGRQIPAGRMPMSARCSPRPWRRRPPFVTAAAIDWVWEMTVIPVAFFLLAAVLRTSAGSRQRPAARGSEAWSGSRSPAWLWSRSW